MENRISSYNEDEDIEQMDHFLIKEKDHDEESNIAKVRDTRIYRDNKVEWLNAKKAITVLSLIALISLYGITPIVMSALDHTKLNTLYNTFKPKGFQVNFTVFIILWVIVLSK
jgi:hypothetical protein